MRIEVTQEDIDNGVRFEPCGCPIALAAKRVLPANSRLLVGTQEGLLESIVLRVTTSVDVPFPVEAWVFIDHFDCEKPVRPFAFDLEVKQ